MRRALAWRRVRPFVAAAVLAFAVVATATSDGMSASPDRAAFACVPDSASVARSMRQFVQFYGSFPHARAQAARARWGLQVVDSASITVVQDSATCVRARALYTTVHVTDTTSITSRAIVYRLDTLRIISPEPARYPLMPFPLVVTDSSITTVVEVLWP